MFLIAALLVATAAATRRELTGTAECKTSFEQCNGDGRCFECFADVLKADEDDYDPARPCSEVIATLLEDPYFKQTPNSACFAMDEKSSRRLCAVFSGCSDEWDPTAGYYYHDDDYGYFNEQIESCDPTKCSVEDPSRVGDGTCDTGCYNSAACGYDGGDCCVLTCGQTSKGFCAGCDAAKCFENVFDKQSCKDPMGQGCGVRAQATVTQERTDQDSSLTIFHASSTPVMSLDFGTSHQQKDLCLGNDCYVVQVTADEKYTVSEQWTLDIDDRPVVSGSGPQVCWVSVDPELGVHNSVEDGYSTHVHSLGCSKLSSDGCDDKNQYFMDLRDSGFNGWESSGFTIAAARDLGTDILASGTLTAGHAWIEPVCLQEDCYIVDVERGADFLGEESWVLAKKGHGLIAAGIAPDRCAVETKKDACKHEEIPLCTTEVETCGDDEVLYSIELTGTKANKKIQANDASFSVTSTKTGEEILSYKGPTKDISSHAANWRLVFHQCLPKDECFEFSMPTASSVVVAVGTAKRGLAFDSATVDEPKCTFSTTTTDSSVCPGLPCAETEKIEPSKCKDDEVPVIAHLIDSWGDGWNGATMVVKSENDETNCTMNAGDGSFKDVELCLTPGCYAVEVTGGDWHEEIAWQLRLSDEVITEGSAPMQCHFGIASKDTPSSYYTSHSGDKCPWWCTRRDITEDDWLNNDDEFNDDVVTETRQRSGLLYGGLPYMYYDDMSDEDPEDEDLSYGWYYGDYANRCDNATECDDGVKMGPEFAQGWYAVSALSDCLDSEAGYATEDSDPFDPALWYRRPSLCDGTFDFGALDDFELCAAEYDQGDFMVDGVSDAGVKARSCLEILGNVAIQDGADELVQRLAKMGYYYGNAGFCDCGDLVNGTANIPNCGDFADFRTVVSETLAVCSALDTIDCAYLGYYADACLVAFGDDFNGGFSKDPATLYEQCRIVDERGCADPNGGSTPLLLPAVRRWDCLSNGELSPKQIDFLQAVMSDCEGQGPVASNDKATNSPTSAAFFAETYETTHLRSNLSYRTVILIVALSVFVGALAGSIVVVLSIRRRRKTSGWHRLGRSHGADDTGSELTYAVSPFPVAVSGTALTI